MKNEVANESLNHVLKIVDEAIDKEEKCTYFSTPYASLVEFQESAKLYEQAAALLDKPPFKND
jgi:hypothetical protein